MIQIAQPQYIWLLAIIPALLVVYALHARNKRKALSRFGNIQLMKPLMPLVSVRRGWFKVILLCLALFFFTLGLIRPQLGARLKEVKREGVEIIIALDVSNSMLAQDFTPNRLERAKLAISRLVDKMRNDRIGLIVFAGDAYVQLPVTTDYVSAKIFLNSISPGIVPKQGTAIGAAIITSIRSFSLQSDEKSRVLVIITDGENHEDDAVAASEEAAKQGIAVYTIGIGSEEGKPIPMGDGSMLKDREGNIVVTKLDEITLQKIATAGRGSYTRASSSDLGLDRLIEDVRNMEKRELSSVVFSDYDEQYMYFFGIALFFLVLEIFVLERKNRWTKSFDIFKRA